MAAIRLLKADGCRVSEVQKMGGALRRRFTSALAALMLVMTAPGAFAAAPCAELPPTDLRLQPLSVDDVHEVVASANEIARLSTVIREDVPHPLMAVRYAIDSNVAPVHRLVPAIAGGFCNAPETVIFGFGVTRRLVVLASQAMSDSCIKSALLAHEAEHYRLVSEAIRTFLQEKEAELAEQLRELKAQRAADEVSAKSTMETGLLSASARLMEEFTQEARQIREQIDSPSRLAELSASCHGRIDALERSVRHGERKL
jgi:hypothetical protein